MRPGYWSLLILLCFLSLGCRDKGTEPPQGSTPGKRDYTWTVDTLAYPGSFQTLMIGIWASSPKDVYVVGHNDQAGWGTMYHFDGSKWTPVSLLANQGGTINQGFDLFAIYGFASNDIYAVGLYSYDNPTPPPNSLDSSLIIHFDGSQWREMQLPERGSYLASVWGASPTDVWFGGSYGTLYHYDGVSIKKTSFDSLTGFEYIAGFSASNVYATCDREVDFSQPYDSSFYLLYHYDGQSWTPVDSFAINPSENTWKFGLSLWASPHGTLYSANYGVYLLNNGLWSQVLANDWPLRMSGSSEQNIFAVGDVGRVFQWNGTDWKRWTEIEDQNKILTGVWTNNVETFIVGYNGLVTFIIHGK